MKCIARIRQNLVYRAAREFLLRYFQDGVGRTGAELAYFLLFSFFPLIIFFTLLISTFQIDVFALQNMLQGVIPDEVLQIALNYIEYLSAQDLHGLMVSGLVLSLWSASRAMRSLAIAVNRAYRIRDRRHFVLQFLINLSFSAAILLSFVLALVLMLAGPGVMELLDNLSLFHAIEIQFWNILRFLPMTLLFFGVVVCLYSIVPNQRIRIRQVIPGALVAMIGWLAASICFSFYVENMGRYSLLYGSIGAVIVLLLWLYLTGVILVMGAELNHVLYLAKNQQGEAEFRFDSAKPLPRAEGGDKTNRLSFLHRHRKM